MLLFLLSQLLVADVQAGLFLDKIMHAPFLGNHWVEELQDRIDFDYGVTVARGRSLQGPHTDENNPRLVLHSKLDGEDFYIGINRQSGEAEVIDWNAHTKEYDFTVIRDLRATHFETNSKMKSS